MIKLPHDISELASTGITQEQLLSAFRHHQYSHKHGNSGDSELSLDLDDWVVIGEVETQSNDTQEKTKDVIEKSLINGRQRIVWY